MYLRFEVSEIISARKPHVGHYITGKFTVLSFQSPSVDKLYNDWSLDVTTGGDRIVDFKHFYLQVTQ